MDCVCRTVGSSLSSFGAGAPVGRMSEVAKPTIPSALTCRLIPSTGASPSTSAPS